MANPWMKFYTSDWRSDPRLKMCSAGARGVWIEMICLMHEATPYGHLLIHGQTPNEAQLASLTGIPLAELEHYVSELEQMGVFSRTKEGVIYSRKLVRMASRSAKMRKNGKQGGNPKLRKSNDNPDQLNQGLNPKDKPQKPETRSQIYEDAYASLSPADNGPPPVNDISNAVSRYNAAAEKAGWPKVQKMGSQRTRSLKARLADCGGIDGWEDALRRAFASDFIRNQWNGFGFDDLISQKKFTKLMEGNYDNRNGNNRPQQRSPSGYGSGTVDAFAEVARRRAQANA